MTPWFVLSYPRSRTAWLSVFLQGAGVPCFHEAWKLATTANDVRRLMEQAGDGPVCNSDCSNIFFLPEIRQEFPEARFLVLTRDHQEVLDSLKASYGPHDYREMMEWYRAAFDAMNGLDHIQVDCRTWDMEVSAHLYYIMTGREIDRRWLAQVSGLLVELLPRTILDDTIAASCGQLHHIEQAMRRTSWV